MRSGDVANFWEWSREGVVLRVEMLVEDETEDVSEGRIRLHLH